MYAHAVLRQGPYKHNHCSLLESEFGVVEWMALVPFTDPGKVLPALTSCPAQLSTFTWCHESLPQK